jgi:hypothetical protein
VPLLNEADAIYLGKKPVDSMWLDGLMVWPTPLVVFAPDQLPGLGLWLQADKITALADGDPVSTWYDASSKGRNATAYGNAPKYRGAAVNGMPAVEFTGQSAITRLKVPGWGTALTGSSSYTMFQVIQQRGNFGNYPVIATAPTDSIWQWLVEYDSNPGWFYWGHGNGRFRYYNAAVPLNQTRLFSFVHADGVPKFYQQGVEQTTYSFGGGGDLLPTVPNIGTDVIVGGYYEGSYGIDGYLCALLWYDRALSDPERLQVETYLKEKWSIT